VYAAVTDFTQTVTLDADRTVFIWYSLSWHTAPAVASDWAVLDTQLTIDGSAEASTTATQGLVHTREVFGTNVGMWMGTLAAGFHTFGLDAKGSNDRTFISRHSESNEERVLRVLVI
jgi:hypothetical protein